MKRFCVGIFGLLLQLEPASAQVHMYHMYLCRSPLLAYNFFQAIQDVAQQGVSLTPAITDQICSRMRAGADPQCIKIEASDFKPFETGWNGTLALTDGVTRVWFHNPDAYGWVVEPYYVNFVSHKQP